MVFAFFAEDIFGNQFCVKDDKIYLFDAETSDFEFVANNLEHWAELILAEYDVFTGYKIAHQWQIENGAIPPSYRLVPRIPFVLGGEFSLDNLYLCSSVESMRSRANIANQILDLPDGMKIQIKVEK